MGASKEIYLQMFSRKLILRKMTHPQSWNFQEKLMGEKLKGEK